MHKQTNKDCPTTETDRTEERKTTKGRVAYDFRGKRERTTSTDIDHKNLDYTSRLVRVIPRFVSQNCHTTQQVMEVDQNMVVIGG